MGRYMRMRRKRIVVTTLNLPSGVTLEDIARWLNESLWRAHKAHPEEVSDPREVRPILVLTPEDPDDPPEFEPGIELEREPGKEGKPEGRRGRPRYTDQDQFPSGTIFDRPYTGESDLPQFPMREFCLLDDAKRRRAIRYERSDVYVKFARTCLHCHQCRYYEKPSGQRILVCSRFFIWVSKNGSCIHHDNFVDKFIENRAS